MSLNTPTSAPSAHDTSPVTSSSSKSGKLEDRRNKTLLNILPKLPSSDSLSNSPGPGSPSNNSLTSCTLF